MWWLAVIFLSVFGMGILYLYTDCVKHNRKEKERKLNELEKAKEALQDALLNHKDDIALHSACYDRIKRLQDEL